MGDLFLLSLKESFLLAGIITFFLAHVAFASAFYLSGFDTAWFVTTLILTAICAFCVLRWLLPNLDTVEKIAVPSYIASIALMIAFAIGASVSSLPIEVGLAAVLFAISDISVARDRFVKQDNMNKTWGLPLYYIAQLIFATTVVAVAH